MAALGNIALVDAKRINPNSDRQTPVFGLTLPLETVDLAKNVRRRRIEILKSIPKIQSNHHRPPVHMNWFHDYSITLGVGKSQVGRRSCQTVCFEFDADAVAFAFSSALRSSARTSRLAALARRDKYRCCIDGGSRTHLFAVRSCI